MHQKYTEDTKSTKIKYHKNTKKYTKYAKIYIIYQKLPDNIQKKQRVYRNYKMCQKYTKHIPKKLPKIYQKTTKYTNNTKLYKKNHQKQQKTTKNNN